MEENRKKALAAALGQIEKQFGKGTVMRLGETPASWDVETVSTGSLGLDIALGVGGLPRGRVTEVFGPEASGKTDVYKRQGLELDDQARDLIGEAGFDPVYGARPLKRAIQQQIENPLAQRILKGEFVPGSRIRATVRDGALSFKQVPA